MISRTYKILLISVCLIFQYFISALAQNVEDVVYFKNGNRVRGTIIEKIDNETIKIRTNEGLVYVYKLEDIEKIRKEKLAGNRRIDTTANNRGSFKGGKNPNLAFLFSFIISVGGQIYNGEYAKASLMLGLDIGASVTANYALKSRKRDAYGHFIWSDKGLFIGSIIVLVVNDIWSIADAVKSANKINRQLGLGWNYKINSHSNLSIKPEYTYAGSGWLLSPIFGAKLALDFN